jgi:hypothetical protein
VAAQDSSAPKAAPKAAAAAAAGKVAPAKQAAAEAKQLRWQPDLPSEAKAAADTAELEQKRVLAAKRDAAAAASASDAAERAALQLAAATAAADDEIVAIGRALDASGPQPLMQPVPAPDDRALTNIPFAYQDQDRPVVIGARQAFAAAKYGDIVRDVFAAAGDAGGVWSCMGEAALRTPS